jgi:metal-responsive CopG/Arc/MetJ family transcriptional regulator
MRTLVDIPDESLGALEDLRARRGVSRAALIRAAIGDYLKQNPPPDPTEAFGLWRERAVDGLEYQRRQRDEW